MKRGGGWCPKGRKAEDGVIDSRYQLRETPSADYLQRTEWNVRDSDGTVIFTVTDKLTGGSRRTADFAAKHHKPCLHLAADRPASDPAQLSPPVHGRTPNPGSERGGEPFQQGPSRGGLRPADSWSGAGVVSGHEKPQPGGMGPVKGLLAIALRAKADGRAGMLVPADNAAEAAVMAGLNVIPTSWAMSPACNTGPSASRACSWGRA